MSYEQAKDAYGGKIVTVLYYEKILHLPSTETVLNRVSCASQELLKYTCFETRDDGERTGSKFNFYV